MHILIFCWYVLWFGLYENFYSGKALFHVITWNLLRLLIPQILVYRQRSYGHGGSHFVDAICKALSRENVLCARFLTVKLTSGPLKSFLRFFFHQNAFQAGKWMKKSIKNALKVYISLLPTNSYDKQLLESKKLWLQFSCQICPLCLLPAWSRDVAEDALQGQAKKLVGEVKNYDCY